MFGWLKKLQTPFVVHAQNAFDRRPEIDGVARQHKIQRDDSGHGREQDGDRREDAQRRLGVDVPERIGQRETQDADGDQTMHPSAGNRVAGAPVIHGDYGEHPDEENAEQADFPVFDIVARIEQKRHGKDGRRIEQIGQHRAAVREVKIPVSGHQDASDGGQQGVDIPGDLVRFRRSVGDGCGELMMNWPAHAFSPVG